MAFTLNCYPIVYRSQFKKNKWKKGEYLEKPHNNYDDMPLVNYTTQYGISCFEGLKALPQKNGGLAIFRPDQNAARFARSMKGLCMPPFPEDSFAAACIETV